MLNPFSNRKVIRDGEPARAWVRRMPAPPRGTSPQSITMTLDVERADGARYEVQDRWMVAGDEPIAVGTELRVFVDPERGERLAIDWERTRAVHREKTEQRRELLSVGVPVPVAKIREAAAERGLAGSGPPAPAESPPPSAGEAKPAVSLTRGAAAVGGKPAEPAPDGTAEPAPSKPAEPPPPAPAEPAPSALADDLLERLERLAALHASGSLTDDEFAAVKRHLIP